MADKNKNADHCGFILEGARIEGKVTFVNPMRINGEVEGEIVSKSQLIVQKNARIKADVKVAHLVVMGRLEGTISDCDLLEIQEGGQVFADITVKKLDISKGAIFEGRCTMVSEASKGQK